MTAADHPTAVLQANPPSSWSPRFTETPKSAWPPTRPVSSHFSIDMQSDHRNPCRTDELAWHYEMPWTRQGTTPGYPASVPPCTCPVGMPFRCSHHPVSLAICPNRTARRTSVLAERRPAGYPAGTRGLAAPRKMTPLLVGRTAQSDVPETRNTSTAGLPLPTLTLRLRPSTTWIWRGLARIRCSRQSADTTSAAIHSPASPMSSALSTPHFSIAPPPLPSISGGAGLSSTSIGGSMLDSQRPIRAHG